MTYKRLSADSPPEERQGLCCGTQPREGKSCNQRVEEADRQRGNFHRTGPREPGVSEEGRQRLHRVSLSPYLIWDERQLAHDALLFVQERKRAACALQQCVSFAPPKCHEI